MKTSFRFSVGVLLFCLVTNMHGQSIDLFKNWYFQIGDSSVWSAENYNHTHWKTMEQMQYLEDIGYPDFSGFAWFRKKVVIPGTWKESAKTMPIYLVLDGVDDNDQTFFNGKFIGETGTMPPNYVQGFGILRKYRLDPSNIRWDQENTIAIRLYDHLGGGGFYGRTYQIVLAGKHMPIDFAGSIAGYALKKHQRAYTFETEAPNSLQQTASVLGYVRFESSMSGTVSLFCNKKYISESTRSKNHIFLVPVQWVNFQKSNEMVVYTEKKEPEEWIIYSKNTFNAAEVTDLIQLSVKNKLRFVASGQNWKDEIRIENKSSELQEVNLEISVVSDAGLVLHTKQQTTKVKPKSVQTLQAELPLPLAGCFKINYTMTPAEGRVLLGTLCKGMVE